MSEPYFSLVVLCYRSGHSIIPFIEKLREALSRCNFSSEIVLVGNYVEGSDDETPGEIDDERAVWECAAEALSCPDRDEISRTGPGSAGETNPEKAFHRVSPFGSGAALEHHAPTAAPQESLAVRDGGYGRTPPPTNA